MNEDQTIQEALNILEDRMVTKGALIGDNLLATQFLTLKLAEQEREVFAVLLLDTHLHLIEYKELFFGTIDEARIHPREVVKAALYANATAMIIAHNHPSGMAEPSQADINLTRRLADILKVVDVRIVDHVLVAGMETVSFRQRGLI